MSCVHMCTRYTLYDAILKRWSDWYLCQNVLKYFFHRTQGCFESLHMLSQKMYPALYLESHHEFRVLLMVASLLELWTLPIRFLPLTRMFELLHRIQSRCLELGVVLSNMLAGETLFPDDAIIRTQAWATHIQLTTGYFWTKQTQQSFKRATAAMFSRIKSWSLCNPNCSLLSKPSWSSTRLFTFV